MGATLLVADERLGYTLTDRATLTAFQDRVDLVSLRAEEPALINVYHVIELNPEGRPRVNRAGAHAFATWITSAARAGGHRRVRERARRSSWPRTGREP